MKVLLSWSGEKSRAVGVALRDWLPLVINELEPFVSSQDIAAGTHWQTEVAGQLEASDFGIICATADNQEATWLNFEAGYSPRRPQQGHLEAHRRELSGASVGRELISRVTDGVGSQPTNGVSAPATAVLTPAGSRSGDASGLTLGRA